MGGLWHGATCTKIVGTFHHQESVGQDQSWLLRKKKGRKGSKATGNRGRRAKGSWSLLGIAVTCALKVYQCVVHTTQGGRVVGKAIWKNSEKMTGSVLGQVFKVRDCNNEVEADCAGHSEHCAGHSA